MSRRPDLPAAGDPVRPAGTGPRWRAQGLSSAGLALVLLVAMIATQRPAPGPAQPVSPAPPVMQPAAAPPVAAPGMRDARVAVPDRTTVRSGRTAVRPPAAVRQRAPMPAAPAARSAVAPAVHGPMERRYVTDAHTAGVCPAGTQSPGLGLTCRGAQVRRAGAAGVVLQFQVCPTTSGRFDLRFAGEGEVAVRVLDRSAGAVWTWRPERPFRDDPHVLATEVGACWTWQTAWRQVDDRGRSVPDGRYVLEVDFLEVDDAQTYLHPFDAGT